MSYDYFALFLIYCFVNDFENITIDQTIIIPWSGDKWCLFLGSTDRSTITRLRAESEDDVVFMSLSYRLQIVFTCFVPNTGKRVIILDVLMAMHWRQDSITPDHGIYSKITTKKEKRKKHRHV